jgi:hypothetical protein
MILQVKITPNSPTNSLQGWQGDTLRIRISAPPDKNKANEELIDFLATLLDLPKSHIRILTGHTSRLKKLEITSDNTAIRKKILELTR